MIKYELKTVNMSCLLNFLCDVNTYWHNNLPFSPRFRWDGSTSKALAWLSRVWKGIDSRRTWKSLIGNWPTKTGVRLVRYRNTTGSQCWGSSAQMVSPAWILLSLILLKCSRNLHLSSCRDYKFGDWSQPWYRHVQSRIQYLLWYRHLESRIKIRVWSLCLSWGIIRASKS